MLVTALGMMLALLSAGLGLTDTFELPSAKAKKGEPARFRERESKELDRDREQKGRGGERGP